MLYRTDRGDSLFADRAPCQRSVLSLADIRLGPADPETLDALITTGTAASRAEAVGWILARIRERPAYARLSERARELDQLKAHFCLRKREAPLQRQVRQR